MNEVLKFLLESNKPLMEPLQLGAMTRMSDHEWQNFVDEVRGMIVTYPGKVGLLLGSVVAGGLLWLVVCCGW